MGSPTDKIWINQFEKFYRGLRVLDVGCGHDKSITMRQMVESSGTTYIGVDMNDHPNVDIKHDMTQPLDIEPVDLVICISMLEHCANPFAAARTMQDVLNPRGVLAVAAPFSWRIHAYPDDYWRFTPSGFRVLFDEIEWKEIWPIPLVELGQHPKERIQLHGWGRKI